MPLRASSHPGEPQFPQLFCPCMVQLLAGIISLRRVLEAKPGRSHGSTDTLPLRHSANYKYSTAITNIKHGSDFELTKILHISPVIEWTHKQGKSEGFESCDQPIVRKRPIWVKIGDVLHRVTLKFDGWPWKTIGLLSFAVSSFVQHFIAIGEFKLELQSGNAQFGSNSKIFRAVWPWNLTYDLEKQ